jgi:hypothetical protein
MSNVTISKLLEQRLNTIGGWPAATAFENLEFTPVDGTPWQRLNFLPGQTENPTLGEGFKREVGILQVTLFYPTKLGRGAAVARAEVLRAGFKRGTTLTEGTLRVMIHRDPFIGPGQVIDGAWYALPVSIPYFGDVFG